MNTIASIPSHRQTVYGLFLRLKTTITGYGSTLYIGIAMVFVFFPYIWKISSYTVTGSPSSHPKTNGVRIPKSSDPRELSPQERRLSVDNQYIEVVSPTPAQSRKVYSRADTSVDCESLRSGTPDYQNLPQELGSDAVRNDGHESKVQQITYEQFMIYCLVRAAISHQSTNRVLSHRC